VEEAGARVHELAHTARQVVEHRHVVTQLDEAVHDIGTDEPGATGHENAHVVLRETGSFTEVGSRAR
jgi:hypothetical protein